MVKISIATVGNTQVESTAIYIARIGGLQLGNRQHSTTNKDTWSDVEIRSDRIMKNNGVVSQSYRKAGGASQ